MCFLTALSPQNENVYREILLPPSFPEWFLLNPVFPLAPALENGANELASALFMGYLTLNTTCHHSQFLRISYKLKDSVNALSTVNHMTLSLHFHFNLSCECED